MPQDRPLPGSAADWLARAEGDLALARVPLPEGAFYEDLCFHAQQAAEKAIKAVYQHCNRRFRYTHDLDELITGLQNEDIAVPPEVVDAASLTSYATGVEKIGRLKRKQIMYIQLTIIEKMKTFL